MKPHHLTILLCISLSAGAQSPQTKYPLAGLKKDFALLRETLQNKYPSLYRYKTKAAMDALIDSCRQSIRDSMTLSEFYRLTATVISALEDGHASARPSDQSMSDFEKRIKLLPLRIWFSGDKAYVLCEKNHLIQGTEILSIDHHSIPEILERIFYCYPSDGAIRTGKLQALNNQPFYFSILYYIVYGPAPAFTIEYLTGAGSTQTISLAADYGSTIHCDIRPEKTKGLSLDFKSNGIAILTVGTFESKESTFNRFLQTSFTNIGRRQCSTLIIDLRNNGGGRDGNGAALFSHLTDKPFFYYASLESVQRKALIGEHPQLRVQQPAATSFPGRVYFLINGNSFSATAEFASVARSGKRGLFIGEETGGGYYGNTSGDDTLLVLPATKIRVDIPLIRYTMSVHPAEYPDRGIIPDYSVLPSFSDVINHKDVQLEYALKLAAAN